VQSILFDKREFHGRKKQATTLENKRHQLEQLMKSQLEVELAVVVGNQAQSNARDDSDWIILVDQPEANQAALFRVLAKLKAV
jgi:predicted nucleotidyltransferase